MTKWLTIVGMGEDGLEGLIFGSLYQFYGAPIAFGSGALLALLAAGVLLSVREPSNGKAIP